MGCHGLHLRRQRARQRDHQLDDRSGAVLIGVQHLIAQVLPVHALMVQQRSRTCQPDTPPPSWTWLVTVKRTI